MTLVNTKDETVRAMTGLHLYHFGRSNCSMRVRIMLAEKALEWKSHVINVSEQENLTDEYFRIHPKGLVPALIHDGQIVIESIDILRYLEKEFPWPVLTPENDEDKRKMDELLDLADSVHLPVVKTYVYGTLRRSTKNENDMEWYGKKQKDEDLKEFHELAVKDALKYKVADAEKELIKLFSDLDATLGMSTWLAGDKFSLADVAWLPQFTLLSGVGFDFYKFPNIRNWYESFRRRGSFEEAVQKWVPSPMFP